MRNPALAIVVVAALAQTLPVDDAGAQDWDPLDLFAEKKRPEPQRQPPPPQGPDTIAPSPGEAKSQAVERIDLAPVMASDGSGLPYELWRVVACDFMAERGKLFNRIVSIELEFVRWHGAINSDQVLLAEQ